MSRRIAAAVVALLGLVLAYAGVRYGSDSLARRDAQDALVAESGGIASQSSGAARARLDRAIEASPGDAELRELRARWLLRDALQATDAAARNRAGEAAVADFRAALAERPRWPYAWSGLATAASFAGGDAAPAAREALRFGPHERRVAAELAELWLLDARVAPVVAPAWTQMLAEQPAYWIDRADRAGRGETACSTASLPGAARARCVELGWLTEAAPQG